MVFHLLSPCPFQIVSGYGRPPNDPSECMLMAI
jgi:hypothetical protein